MKILVEKLFTIEDSFIISLNDKLNSKFLRINLIKQFFAMISKIGSGGFYLMSIIFLSLFRIYGIKFFLSFFIGFIIERILYTSLKKSTKRLRPFERLNFSNLVLMPPDKCSFPSGHTSAAFLYATILISFNPELTLPLIVYAILVGISRIILNLHYPTDVFFGMIIGYSTAKLTFEIIKIINI